MVGQDKDRRQSFENNIVPPIKERGIEHDWKSEPNTICVADSATEIDYKSCLMNTMFQR